MYKKGLALAIILLFIGVSFQPAFAVEDKNSSNSSSTVSENEALDNNLIKMLVQIHISNGMQSYTLELSNQQLDELDMIFDKLKIDLWNCNSEIEVIEIYKDAVVSLGENGLLPDTMSIEEAQELVLKNNFNPRFGKLFYHLLNNLAEDNLLNILCWITGKSSRTGDRFSYYFPIRIFSTLYFGYILDVYNRRPALGWVYTIGMLGVKEQEGSFYGRIYERLKPPFETYYIGALGFRGLIFKGYYADPSYYLGHSFCVHLVENPD